ncbi:hypothetical protein D3C78_1423400 [compost metagenome]
MPLAKRIARNYYIDASVVGAAVNDLKRNPAVWSDRGAYEEVLQELKRLFLIEIHFSWLIGYWKLMRGRELLELKM